MKVIASTTNHPNVISVFQSQRKVLALITPIFQVARVHVNKPCDSIKWQYTVVESCLEKFGICSKVAADQESGMEGLLQNQVTTSYILC